MLPYITQWLWNSEKSPEKEQDDGFEILDNQPFNKEDDWVLIEKSSPSQGHIVSATSQDSDVVSDSGESWIITPPSCLTRNDPVSEIGSLENLLIEHPSMSVYHHRVDANFEVTTSDLQERVEFPIPKEPSHQQLVHRRVSHGRLWKSPTSTQKLNTKDKIRESEVKIPRLTRKALKRHNKHKPNKQAKKSRQQWHVFQPRRR